MVKEKEKEKIIHKVILHTITKYKRINKMVSEDKEKDDTYYSDSDSSVEEVSLKPLRKAMKLIQQELDSTILTMLSVQKVVEKEENKISVKDILNKSLLLKAIDSGVKGVDVYDFISENI